MLAQPRQVPDKISVPGEETGPQPREIRPFRKRVDRDDSLGAVLEDRAAGPGPGELYVALVGEDRHTV